MDFLRFCVPILILRIVAKLFCRHPSPHKHSYLLQVRTHFETLHLKLTDDLEIGFGRAPTIPAVFVPPDISKAYCNSWLAMHATCVRLTITVKDVFPTTGILDWELTSTFWKKSTLEFPDGPPAVTRFESQLVGCTLTRDRLSAAKLLESS